MKLILQHNYISPPIELELNAAFFSQKQKLFIIQQLAAAGWKDRWIEMATGFSLTAIRNARSKTKSLELNTPKVIENNILELSSLPSVVPTEFSEEEFMPREPADPFDLSDPAFFSDNWSDDIQKIRDNITVFQNRYPLYDENGNISYNALLVKVAAGALYSGTDINLPQDYLEVLFQQNWSEDIIDFMAAHLNDNAAYHKCGEDKEARATFHKELSAKTEEMLNKKFPLPTSPSLQELFATLQSKAALDEEVPALTPEEEELQIYYEQSTFPYFDRTIAKDKFPTTRYGIKRDRESLLYLIDHPALYHHYLVKKHEKELAYQEYLRTRKTHPFSDIDKAVPGDLIIDDGQGLLPPLRAGGPALHYNTKEARDSIQNARHPHPRFKKEPTPRAYHSGMVALFEFSNYTSFEEWAEDNYIDANVWEEEQVKIDKVVKEKERLAAEGKSVSIPQVKRDIENNGEYYLF